MIDIYTIIFIIAITYGINYILPIYYVNNCRGFFTFNSPICLGVLSIISYNAYSHIYIFYGLAVYFVHKIFNYIKNKIK